MKNTQNWRRLHVNQHLLFTTGGTDLFDEYEFSQRSRQIDVKIGALCPHQSGSTELQGSTTVTCAMVLAFFLLPSDSLAQESKVETNQEAVKPLRDMTPEERRAAIDAMSDEEREAFREKNRAAMEIRRAEWQAMTPEERQAKRQEMQERREAMTPQEREAMRQRREAAKQRQQEQKNKRPDDAEQDPPV